MRRSFTIAPVGYVAKSGGRTFIEIEEAYTDALLGLEQYSHLIMCFWFHQQDTPERRVCLQVHPRRNKANPLTGVFATRSPRRPNLLGLCVCRIESIHGNAIRIDETDALDGSPVIDIKPYIPRIDSVSDAQVPSWVNR